MSIPSNDPAKHSTPSSGANPPGEETRPSFTDGVLDRYLLGALHPDEADRAQAYFNTSRRQQYLRQLQAWISGAHDPAPPNHKSASAELWQRIGAEDRPKEPFKPRRTSLVEPGRGIWYAMICLVIGALGIIVGWKGHMLPSFTARPVAVSTYATTSGERARITLPDGNTVVLGVASRLDVPVDYAAGHHTVHLVGEALFTVTRHDGTPFVVTAGKTTARVLGTSFAVRHYNTDTTATIAVHDGKVAVGNVVVTAAQLAEVDPTGATRLETADPSAFGFATGVLTIKHTPLSGAIADLDRWYAADIRVADPSLAKIPIEGDFTEGSLSDLSNLLELMLNVRTVRNGRTLTLYPRGR